MRASDVAEMFWQAKPCKLGERDRVVVEGSAVSYLLWGHEIARWLVDEGLLIVCDCGWQTWLTEDRLNNILTRVNYHVYSDRGQWFILDRVAQKSYYWKKCHRIHVGERRIEPAVLRVKHPEISERLKAYYERARGAIESKNRTLIVRTLGGTAYVFADHPYGLKVYVLVVKTHSPEFEAWHGRISRSAIYAAFLRSEHSKILGELDKELEKIDDPNKADRVLSTLRDMGFSPQSLPEDLASSLALAKMLEC